MVARAKKYETELCSLISRFQDGDGSAGWQFVQHVKIQAIIRGRIRNYRRMFHWLGEEDFEDVACGLTPRILEVLGKFVLAESMSDGQVISYFASRILGEADFLLKNVTGMKQVTDKETGTTYFKSYSQSIDGLEDTFVSDVVIDETVINSIEQDRRGVVVSSLFETIPEDSNDRIWLRCYLLRLQNKTWAEIAQEIEYKQTDFTWIKDNTARFVTRLKHTLLSMGEEVSYRICGIYCDPNLVSIYVFDSNDPKRQLVWLKEYDSWEDLDKVEGKFGDIFRKYEITYVIINQEIYDSRASTIAQRYLAKREAFVESLNLQPFLHMVSRMPNTVNGVKLSEFHKRAYLLAQVKRAEIETIKRRREDANKPAASGDIREA